jgi:tetratricopeptide (TPR) repeat protein
MTALALAQSHFDENSLEVAACLNCIGVLHYMMSNGKDDIALDALQTSLRIRIELLGEDHIDVGTTWNNIGRMNFQLGKFDSAMEAYCEALRIRRKCQGESVDVAATLFNCGQVYHNLKCRDKALSLFHEFLEVAKTHFGEFHRDICIVTTCIGQVLHESKDYENALKTFEHALRIGYVALGPMHSEMAIALNKMGNLYYETGDFDSALDAYHRGLEIEITVLETGNPNTFVTYANIAEIRKCHIFLNHHNFQECRVTLRSLTPALFFLILSIHAQISKRKNMFRLWNTTKKFTTFK